MSDNTIKIKNFRKGLYRVPSIVLDGNVIQKTVRFGDYLTADPSSIEFEYSGSTASLGIDTDEPWTASTADDWVSISQISGRTASNISLTASDNSSGSTDRSGSLTISTPYITKIVTYEQSNTDWDPVKTPLTIEMLGDGNLVFAKGTYAYNINAWCKVNDGEPISITNATVTIPVLTGDKIAFYGYNNALGNRDNALSGWNFSATTANHIAYGNIMSILSADTYTTATTLSGKYALAFMFDGDAKLVSERKRKLLLPATSITTRCYQYLFRNTIGVTECPVYGLPATDFGNGNAHYQGMFYGCSNMTSVPPELPCTSLTIYYPYIWMFQGCSSITESPVIKATTATGQWVMREMFLNCSSLNKIYVPNMTNFNTNALQDWVSGVSATGTFYKNPNATWTAGTSGYPSGWTVVDADV